MLKTSKYSAVIALSLSLFASPSLFAAEYFPIQPGNLWVYRSDRDAKPFTVRVGFAPIQHNGLWYHKLTGYASEPLFVRTNESGALIYWDQDTDQEVLLTSFEPSAPFWWPAPKRASELEGQVGTERHPYDGPAGHFQGTLPIFYRSTNAGPDGIQEEHFLENIGMLSRVSKHWGETETFHLVYARLGTVTIAESPGSSFRVSLREESTRRIAALRLSLQAPTSLSFDSSQEYDVSLYDQDNQLLWRWSDGQFFTQQSRLKYAAELGYEVELPSEWNGQLLPPGLYRVEAWLTTSGDARQFAAAATFTILAEAKETEAENEIQ